MLATLVTGHGTLADLLLIFAAIVFVVDALVRLSGRPDPTRGALIAVGLALVSAAILVV